MELFGWWASLGHETPPPQGDPIPVEWFPWTLGNIRPANHVFVRNAALLPLRPDCDMIVRDLGMGSCLHLPLHDGFETVGAVCMYWSAERDDWPLETAHELADLGRDALLDCH